MVIVIRAGGPLSSIEELRLHIGDLVERAKTEDEPAPPVVRNSAELFVFLTAFDWGKLRTEMLLASDHIQKNSPAFKNAVKSGMIRGKDTVCIITNSPKEAPDHER